MNITPSSKIINTSRPEERWLRHASRPSKVLFLDDDEQTCRLLSVWLKPYNIELICSHTIKEAKAVVENHLDQFVALVLDVRVSNGTGMQLYQMVMDTKPDVRVIFLTGNDSPAVRDQIEKIGPAQVYNKANALNPQFIDKLIRQLGVSRLTTPPFDA